jgi:hypothetical protein
MNLERVFRDKIKPELNFLYTEPLSDREGGGDFGWFCKEHAYHGLLVAKALGCKAEIRRGHIFIVTRSGTGILSSFGEDRDHVWLSVNEVWPVDLSLTLKYIAPQLAPVDLVYGQGPRGEYQIRYAVGEAEEPEAQPSAFHTLHYAELGVLPHPAESLLENPVLLLDRPERGGLTEELGQEIFAQVTLHLVRVAKGEINPQVGYAKDAIQAFKRIKDRNPDARQKVKQMM